MVVVVGAGYTLDQAQKDIADLRGQLAHLLAYAVLLQLIVDTQFTAPDGSVWDSTGLQLDSSWTTATLTNSGDWTSVVALSYKKYPDKTVGLLAELNSTGTIATNRQLTTLPTGYRPSGTVRLTANYNTGTGTVGAVLLSISNAGVVTTFPSIPPSSTLNIECRFRTDN